MSEIERIPCIHESNIAEMKTNVEHVVRKVDKIEDMLTNGLSTQVALNKQSIGRVWWWLGGVSLAILGVACKAIFL